MLEDKEVKETQLQWKIQHEKINLKVIAKERRLKRDKSEGNGEREKTKKTPRQDQTKQTKQDLPKQPKKILSASRERKNENSSTTRYKGSKTVLE